MDGADLESLWADILSREPKRVARALEQLDPGSRTSVVAHLKRMATEVGWQPSQQLNARAALQTLGLSLDPWREDNVMPEPQTTLPHWDVSVVYSSLESADFQRGFQATLARIDELIRLADTLGVPGPGVRGPVDDPRGALEKILVAQNATLEDVSTLEAYIYAFVSTDTRNDMAQARLSELQQARVKLNMLTVRLTAWIGGLDIEAMIGPSKTIADHAYLLRRAKTRAQHLMPADLEGLAAELSLTGSTAWEKLHSTFTSQLMVPLEIDGRVEQMAMSAVRNFRQDPDPALRRRAYEAEIAAWHKAEVPLAAAMNSIKGEVLALARRRGWSSPLDAALFDHGIDRSILEAMQSAAVDSFPDFRRYLQAKARALGKDKLAWYDIEAPVGASERAWGYAESRAFIEDEFGRFTPSLGSLARRAFDERWIDAEPREGKVDGAFCMWLRRGESRVLANFHSTYQAMTTLAHELGHAFHNRCQAERSALQRVDPMTLAETASIFCETLIEEASQARAEGAELLGLLEQSLQGPLGIVVDIHSRFLFEQEVFSRRSERELSADEFCEMLLAAQQATYADGLEPSTYHKYMWAMKPHYYSAELSFYNFPYTFGLLFGLGLYAQYLDQPQAFRAKYEDLLSRTGMAAPASLASDFGIDIRSTSFWRSSLDVVRRKIDRFVELVGKSAR
ncbi:MAG TPA: M3 family oligoendopeptidase [Anaerolineales bacterium]|nr:M3 family oligoendopeptidase [Anaerolineales bacterium]